MPRAELPINIGQWYMVNEDNTAKGATAYTCPDSAVLPRGGPLSWGAAGWHQGALLGAQANSKK